MKMKKHKGEMTMKLNKTLASALLLSVALTSCNNMVENEDSKDKNEPVVEENKDKGTNKAEDTAENKDDKDNQADEKDEDSEKNTDEVEDEATDSDENSQESETKDTANLSKDEKIEALEQSIFDNRSSARAVELLFELSPETANQHSDELNELLDNSNMLLEKAQTALEELKAE